MDSIARDHGFLWETLWNLPENAQLKQVRKDPFVLLEGDRVYIPPVRNQYCSCATDRLHRFRKRGDKGRLRVQLLDEDQPLSDQPFMLLVDGKPETGTTDSQGWIDKTINRNARKALLHMENRPVMEFQLGGIDPVSTPSGVRARLDNLGFDCRAESGP